MQTIPTLGPRYWAVLCLASIFGADLGDTAAHVLGLGHWHGLPILAILFAATLRAGRHARTAAWYWIAIVIVRTAATNFADLQTHDIRLPFPILMLGYASLLAGLVALSRRTPGVARANLSFWAGMLVAGTLGTVAGDDLSHMLHGPAGSSVVMSLVMAASFVALQRRAATVVGFWLLVVVIRTWGTDVGDWLTDTLGLGVDTWLSGVCFVWLAGRKGQGSALDPQRASAL